MKNKETNVEFFIRVFSYWRDYLHLPQEIRVKKDARINCYALVSGLPDIKCTVIKINPNIVNGVARCVVLNSIFHELGHILYNLPSISKSEQILDERTAEKYALKMIKKYYLKEYKCYLKWIKKTDYLEGFKYEDTIYYEAYKTIPEYGKCNS